MPTVIVPFAGAAGKTRLLAPERVRRALALAMLGDVLDACVATGPAVVVTSDAEAAALARELGVEARADPGGGQGAAVAAALASVDGPALVVNADLPCVVADDLQALLAAAAAGAALVEAADGTTNALALALPSAFAPLYGPGSAARFRTLLDAVSVDLPGLADDVDTLDDLRRLAVRCGPRTRACVTRELQEIPA